MLEKVAFADVNGDGDLDVLLAANNTIEARDGMTGTLLKSYTLNSNVTAFSGLDRANVPPPVVDAGPDAAIEEGSCFLGYGSVSVSSGGGLTATVDYGDGSGPQPLALESDNTFELSHVYADDGEYTVTVTVQGEAGPGSDTLVVTVNNVLPEITDLINSAPEPGMGMPGEPVDVMAMFSDSGWFDAHTATIDWGDGSQSAGDVVEIGGAGFVSATHAYASGGVYTITLTVSDDDGGTVSRTTNALITGVGIQNGVLHIVGTDGNDRVRVVPYRGRSLIVFASFLQGPGSPPYQIFPAAGIERIEAVLGDGDDFAAVAGTIKLTTILDGGAGNDRLAGGGGANALIGGDGNDFLVGGRGRDLLLGGEGMDSLVGNGGEDILIGGSTNLETSENADAGGFDQALLSVLTEWNTEQPYLTRVGRIRPMIQAVDDNARDLLFGGSGSDWFFAKSRGPNRDRIVGRNPHEFIEELA
jgi:Ca2+-binding RTX toxin-like protein